ncbi:MAG: hypothetical protein HY079_15165 [Elusimicrobia bacterium]|nr:hypothetical protein [Elusimicrobiota bacterium]
MNRPLAALLSAAALFAAAPVRAQDAPAARLGELERKVDALTSELEKLRLGAAAEAPSAVPAQPGLSPSASKVYGSALDKVSLGGYGEFVFKAPSRAKQNGDASGLKKQSDLQRMVLYAGYKFTDTLLLNSEFEFEHGGTGEGSEARGEAAVEQAYLEYRPFKALGARVGHVIVPLGLVNELHEPTAFHGVNRPSVEQTIIPSTWHENGVGVFGEAGPLAYRTYALASLTGAKSTDPDADGFTAANGLRGGRTEGTNSPADDLAWASRADLTVVEGVKAGAGLYLGRAARVNSGATVPVTLWEAHGEAAWRGASVRALYAEGTVGNAGDLNVAQGFTGNQSVGRRLFGGYAEAAFDVLSLFPKAGGQALSPFVRYERYDTQWRVPDGYAKDPANSRVEYTLGLTYKPVSRVALKLDQQWKRNQARTGVNQWNFGVGFIF